MEGARLSVHCRYYRFIYIFLCAVIRFNDVFSNHCWQQSKQLYCNYKVRPRKECTASRSSILHKNLVLSWSRICAVTCGLRCGLDTAAGRRGLVGVSRDCRPHLPETQDNAALIRNDISALFFVQIYRYIGQHKHVLITSKLRVIDIFLLFTGNCFLNTL